MSPVAQLPAATTHSYSPLAALSLQPALRSSHCVLAFLLLLACLLTPSLVSEDGSVRPDVDEQCVRPAANTSYVPVVASADCQWMTIDEQRVSFSYQYNSSDFSLSFWLNPSTLCTGGDHWAITAAHKGSSCAVATYHDDGNNVLFYASIRCSAYWPAQDEHVPGLDELQQAAMDNVKQAERLPQDLLHTLSGLLPNVKHSALHRLVRKVGLHNEQ